jgi:hypothetical protein
MALGNGSAHWLAGTASTEGRSRTGARTLRRANSRWWCILAAGW